MCCENRAKIRPVVSELCLRPINREEAEELPYAAIIDMKFAVPSKKQMCRTFGLTGEQVVQLEEGLLKLGKIDRAA